MSIHFKCDTCSKELKAGIGYLGTVSLTLTVPRFDKNTQKVITPYRQFKVTLNNSCINCISKLKFERIPTNESEKEFLAEQLPILIAKLLKIEQTKTEII